MNQVINSFDTFILDLTHGQQELRKGATGLAHITDSARERRNAYLHMFIFHDPPAGLSNRGFLVIRPTSIS